MDKFIEMIKKQLLTLNTIADIEQYVHELSMNYLTNHLTDTQFRIALSLAQSKLNDIK